MKKFDIQGTGVALVTPFHKQGNVDFTSYEKLIEHVINGGVDYLGSCSIAKNETTAGELTFMPCKGA